MCHRHYHYASEFPCGEGFRPGWKYHSLSHPQIGCSCEYRLSTEQEIDMLKEKSKFLKDALKDIEDKIECLKSKSEKKEK